MKRGLLESSGKEIVNRCRQDVSVSGSQRTAIVLVGRLMAEHSKGIMWGRGQCKVSELQYRVAG